MPDIDPLGLPPTVIPTNNPPRPWPYGEAIPPHYTPPTVVATPPAVIPTPPKPPVVVPPAPAPVAAGQPAWWKPYSYSGAYDPDAELAMTVNALLPSMSPIDKQYWSSWLYQQDPAKFAGYNPANKIDFGPEGGEAQRGAFTSAQRANDAWNFLQKTLLGTGDADPTNDKKIEDMGPAVPWLQRVFEAQKRYAPPANATGTGFDRRTRAQERALQSDLTSLWSEAQSSQDLQPYLEVAKRFVAPSYSTAPISTPTPAGVREGAYNPANYNSYSRMNFVSNPRYL